MKSRPWDWVVGINASLVHTKMHRIVYVGVAHSVQITIKKFDHRSMSEVLVYLAGIATICFSE